MSIRFLTLALAAGMSFSVLASATATYENPFDRLKLPGAKEKLDQDSLFQEGNISNFGLTGTKVLALTFDDGPTATTPAVLDILAKYRIPAVFFVNSKNVPGREKTMQRIFAEGHLLANHTHAHLNLRKDMFYNRNQLFKAISATHEAIRPYLRSDDVLLFRAPFGAWRAEHAEVLNDDEELSRYIGPIFWNIGGAISPRGVQYGAADWDCWRRGISYTSCRTGYINESVRMGGGVVLMHDVERGTAQMLDGYIQTMLAKGYRFVRMDKLPVLKRYQ